MIKRAFWLLFLAVLLAACATTYRHPTKTANDFEKDRQECQLIARKALAAKGVT
jgi:hypothetical protein